MGEVEVDTIDFSKGAAETTSLYTVQFTHSSNAGKQNTLKCQIVTENDFAGAQPKYDSVTLCQVFNVGGPEWFENSGLERTLTLSDFAEFSSLAPRTRTDILTAANT